MHRPEINPCGDDNRPIICSISGGSTSAMMAWLLKNDPYYSHRELHFIFANTGREMPETIAFLRRWESYLGVKIHLVQAITHHNQRLGATHQVMDWESLVMDGEPYKDMVAKYGIPNLDYPHCTRELKANPIRSFIRNVLGLKKGDYVQAVGMRYDEIRRISKNPEFIHPLKDYRIVKSDVVAFFSDPERSNIRLQLESWEGNCDFCFKKSWLNLKRMYDKHPERIGFWQEIETLSEKGDDRVLYRGHRVAQDLIDGVDHQDEDISCTCEYNEDASL